MALALTGTTSATGTFETAFTETFTASGGTAPYVYSVSSGVLPTGLTLNTSSGVVSGTPSVAATFTFTIEVTDAVSATATLAASIAIGGKGWLVINEPSLGLTDRSNYMHQPEGQGHDWNIQLRKRGQATVPLYIAAGDTYAPTRGCPIYLCDVTASGPVVAVTPDFNVYSTAGVGKTLACANLGAIPSGWEQPSFNDSAWIAPLLQTGTTFGTAFAGSQWITPNVSGPSSGIDNDTCLFRIPFTTTSVPPSGSLTLWSDNFNIGVWLNGVQVFSAPPGTTNLNTIPLPGSAFVNGTNVLAIEILNGLAWMDCDFVLTINKAVTTSPVLGAVWSGLIQNLEYKWLDDVGNQIVTITAVSFESVFDTVYCKPYEYVNQTCGYIVNDILTREETGCPVIAGTISAGATIPLLNLNYEKVSDIFDELAKTSQFTWGVDPQTSALFFETPASIPAPFVLQNSNVLFDSVKWTLDGADYRNRQAVKLNYDAFSHSMEFFVGSGQTSFTLMRPVQQVVNAWATLNTCNTATGTFSGQPSPGDTITIGPNTAIGWQGPAHVYGPGGIIIVNGYVQKITFPTSGTGTSGSVAPTFPTITGDTVTDGTLIWTCQGPAGLSTGVDTYTFVSTLDNTQFGQVLIGANDTATCLNLVDCINSNAAIRGITFSLPTWECAQCNAITNTGTAFTLQQKASGSGWIATISASSSHFSWSGPNTTGGTAPQGSLGPGEGATISLGVYASGTSTEAPAVIYTAGSAVITLATPLNTGSNLNVEYTRADGNVIEVEDTALVSAYAAITHGTGKVQQITDDSSQGLISTSAAAGLLDAQTTLESYSTPPQRIEFTTYTPGLFPGMTLVVDLTAPASGTALLNGSWIIEEVKAKSIQTNLPYIGINGHYEYTISLVDLQQTVSYLDFWQGMAGASEGGSGSGGALVSTGGGAQSTTGQGTLELETNGTDNGSQTKLNLIPGAHITITDDGHGDVTIAGTSPLTTKGDVYVRSGTADARLPVGTNGQVLTANSSATNGVDWESVPTPVGGMTVNVNSAVVASGILTVDVNGTLDISGLTVVDVNGVSAGLSVVGTVISIGLTMPGEFSVSGSPVTSSGTLTVTKATQAANIVFAGPSSGGAAVPIFRALVAADLPLATTSLFGAVKPDGSTITISSGVISSAGLTNPMTTSGDVIYGGSSGTPTRLAAGTSGNVLQTNGSGFAPTWVSPGMVLIASNIVSTAVASVTFSSIPGTYRNLRIVWGGRSSQTSGTQGGQDFVIGQFNGDTGANYDFQGNYFQGNGDASANLSAFQTTATASPQIGYLSGNSAPSNTPGAFDTVIANYAGTTFYKTVSSVGGDYGLTSVSGVQQINMFICWHNTAAITSIVFKLGSGLNFMTGSYFYLYGY